MGTSGNFLDDGTVAVFAILAMATLILVTVLVFALVQLIIKRSDARLQLARSQENNDA